MSRRRGVQAEVLLSLAVVMVTATALLSAFFFKTHAAQLDRLRGFVGRALIAEVQAPGFFFDAGTPGARWWIVTPDGVARAKTPDAGPIDDALLALAAEVRKEGRALLQTGAPWEPIRFASRFGSAGQVAAARLPAAVSPWAVLGLLVADGAVFLALGAFLLRERVVAPLRRMAHAARSLAGGELTARVAVEGVGEVADVAWAFNEMSESLERRTGALEKAVAELRDANRDLRRARAGLDRAERLAAVGRLAAGVAHEVGNPMGALLAFLDLTRREGSLSAAGGRHLDRAAGQAERVRTILRQLLDFSRPARGVAAPVELAGVAEQAAGLVRAQKRYAGVEIRVESEEVLALVWADESMLVQILLNLLLNAADAVREQSGARVQVTLRPAPLETRRDEDRRAAGVRRSFEVMECMISDNGPGIPQEDLERIFDPFFTTKPLGEGTGLGLANALRLAEELGGSLECLAESRMGGATFSLRLPVASRPTGSRRIRGG